MCEGVRCFWQHHSDARDLSPRLVVANGQSRSVGLKNLDAEEVAWHVSYLRTEKGHRTGNKVKRHLTSRNSIQGPWTPAGVVMTG